MGRPKALVPADGVPMGTRAAAALVAGGVPSGSVVLVGGDAAWAEALGLRWVPDRWPGSGPLGGIATALLDAPEAAGADDEAIVVIVACDQPWLTGASLARLVGALRAAPEQGVAAARGPEGRRQPFPAAWRAASGAAIEALVAAGERRADAAYGVAQVVEVAMSGDELADVDRPGDLLRDP